MTFGVVPTAPETGYGYIRRGAALGTGCLCDFRIRRKTRCGTRQGIPEVRELPLEQRHVPVPGLAIPCGTGPACAGHRRVLSPGVGAARHDLDFTRVGEQYFSSCRSDSIDYAVMEKTDAAAVVPLSVGWSDVGSWSSLHAALSLGPGDNVIQGDVVLENCSGSYVHASSRLVAAVGLKDHVVVETKDAVMVAPMDRVQDVKALVAAHQGRGSQRTPAAPGGVPALGKLRQRRLWRPLPGQAPDGQPGCCHVAAIAQSPRRALDRGLRHGAHYARRGGLPAGRKPVHLHTGGHEAPHREPRHDRCCT